MAAAYAPMAVSLFLVGWVQTALWRERRRIRVALTAVSERATESSGISPPPHVVEAVAVLNAALAADREAVAKLLALRVPCSDALTAHPSIQVGLAPGGFGLVGVLGLLNGALGTIPTGPRAGCGWVTCVLGEDRKPMHFEVTGSGDDGVTLVRASSPECSGTGADFALRLHP